MNVPVLIERLAPEVELPTRGTEWSAGYDVKAVLTGPYTLAYTPENEAKALYPERALHPEQGSLLKIPAGWRVVVPLGFKATLPQGFEFELRPRSGLAAKHGLTLANAPGTIDADYNEEYRVVLINHTAIPVFIEHGMRIAQLLLKECHTVDWTEGVVAQVTDRDGGFGSTGL